MRRPKVVAIVQARVGATRLPGKVLLKLGGRTVLERVIERVQAIPGVNEVVLAIPKGRAERALRDHAAALGSVKVFEGREADVLDRYYRAASAAKADVVVRITSDCPLLDPKVSGRVLQALLGSGADYASNVAPATYPDGLDTEAFRFKALEAAWREAHSKSEREHVTVFLRNRPDRFRQVNVANSRDLSHLRWTLDEPADLKFLRALLLRLNGGGSDFGFQKVVALLERDPSLSRINHGIRANEGYYRSLLKERPKPAKPLRLKRSLDLFQQAQGLIPGCSQTFSKGHSQFVRGVSPLFLQRGRGCRVWDVDGNSYIDTTMALAPVSLGYCDPDVDAAVIEQLKSGTTLSQPHPLEIDIARLLTETVPCAEMARFGKNGSDATAAAVRLARYATGRDMVAAGGYHGWQDWYIGSTTRKGGVPKAVQRLTKTFQYNKVASIANIFRGHPGQVAAVILEPIGVEEPQGGFLEEVAAMTRRNGAVLIFDEVVTGFRLSLGGAQQHFRVTPDLACFGKAMANGFPLSAVTGRARLMRRFDEIFFSTTFGGELLSLAACRATISKMRRLPVIARFWEQGTRLQDGFNTMARTIGLARHMVCSGLAPHTVISFKRESGEPWWELKSLFQQECVRRGLLFTGAHNMCYAHGAAEVDEVLKIYSAALRRCARAVEGRAVGRTLDGPPVQAIFRKP